MTKKINKKKLGILILIPVLLIGCIGVLVSMFLTPNNDPKDPTKTPSEQEDQPQEQRVSFLAVGDNIGHERVYTYADVNKGEYLDGEYDFLPSYKNVASYIKDADLSFVNQETIIGGDSLGIFGYPAFNTPNQMADDLVTLGFDMVNGASNHTLDRGYTAVLNTLDIWNQYDDVLFSGVYSSQEDADTIRTIERDGITFSLLAYTYSTNGYTSPYDYTVFGFDRDRITRDVAAAKEVSDVVMVSAHWGLESSYELDDLQKEYSQLFADLGVDVVIGTHPHVIQPVEWVEGQDGHKTLVAYSLGNFLSTMETLDTQLEGMLTMDFVKKDDVVTIENVGWTPLVNHFEPGLQTANPTCYLLEDYNEELRAKHYVLSNHPDAIDYFHTQTKKIIDSIDIRK